MVTTVRRVLQISRLRELASLDRFVPDADQLGDAAGFVQLARGETGTDAGDGQSPIAECEVRRFRDDDAIDAARVGDDAPLETAQQIEQAIARSCERFAQRRRNDRTDRRRIRRCGHVKSPPPQCRGYAIFESPFNRRNGGHTGPGVV